MMKKISATVLALVVFTVMAMGCFAAVPPGRVVYDGSALEVTGSVSGFDDMLPGVTYSSSIHLENASGNTANFQMDTQVLSTLVGAGNARDAGYTVLLTCGDTTLFGFDPATGATGTMIGGSSTGGLAELNDQLSGYQLVATLEPGKSADVTVAITPEKTSVNDSYQSSVGSMQFQFQASDVVPQRRVIRKRSSGEDVVVTETRYLIQAPLTGDTATIYIAGGLLAAALLVAALALKKKSKGGNGDA